MDNALAQGNPTASLHTLMGVAGRHKTLLALVSLLPAAITAGVMLAIPASRTATITYAQWLPTRQAFTELVAKFYANSNSSSLVRELRAAGAGEYADTLEDAQKDGITKVQEVLIFEAGPAFPDEDVRTHPRTAEDMQNLRDLRADVVYLRAARCPNADEIPAIIAVLRRNLEQTMALHAVTSQLRGELVRQNEQIARIDAGREKTQIDLRYAKATLDRVEKAAAKAKAGDGPQPVVQYDLTSASNARLLPLAMQADIETAGVIDLEERVKQTDAIYAHTVRLRDLWQRILADLEQAGQTQYDLSAHAAHLESLLGEYSDEAMRQAIRSHLSDAKALRIRQNPVSPDPTVEGPRRRIVLVAAAVFALSLLAGLALAFAADGARPRPGMGKQS